MRAEYLGSYSRIRGFPARLLPERVQQHVTNRRRATDQTRRWKRSPLSNTRLMIETCHLFARSKQSAPAEASIETSRHVTLTGTVLDKWELCRALMNYKGSQMGAIRHMKGISRSMLAQCFTSGPRGPTGARAARCTFPVFVTGHMPNRLFRHGKTQGDARPGRNSNARRNEMRLCPPPSLALIMWPAVTLAGPLSLSLGERRATALHGWHNAKWVGRGGAPRERESMLCEGRAHGIPQRGPCCPLR
jgi:hypothetical protein